jgi:hypothetical protein
MGLILGRSQGAGTQMLRGSQRIKQYPSRECEEAEIE